MLAQLKREYGDRVTFLSLTVEPQDSPTSIEGKLGTSTGLVFARASEAAWQKLMPMGGEEAGVIPAHVLITAKGEVSRAIIGGDGLADAIKALLP